MRIADLNLLIYAVNRDSPRHHRAKAWLEEVLSGEEPVGLPWVVILAFLRLSTHPRILPSPLTPEQAIQVVGTWLERPVVELVHPGPGHWGILRELLADGGTAGNLTTDAHLAALAIELGATLCSSDSDFGRYRRLQWENPLEG